jgi:hypothetical protein
MNLYIYYRVQCERAPQLQQCAVAMQAALLKKHGVAAELQRRHHTQNGQHTWMEIYRAVPDGFDAILAHAVAESGLIPMIDGERHMEFFLDV